MPRTTDQLRQIVASGGGIIMSAEGKTTDQLRQIASSSVVSGAKIIFTNVSNKTTDQLRQIGASGSGNVIFDLRD